LLFAVQLEKLIVSEICLRLFVLEHRNLSAFVRFSLLFCVLKPPVKQILKQVEEVVVQLVQGPLLMRPNDSWQEYLFIVALNIDHNLEPIVRNAIVGVMEVDFVDGWQDWIQLLWNLKQKQHAFHVFFQVLHSLLLVEHLYHRVVEHPTHYVAVLAKPVGFFYFLPERSARITIL
jgi:hypothetical protein